MLGEPRERVVACCVEDDAAAVHEEDAIDVRERSCRALLRHEDRARQVLDEIEERLSGLGIELRRRLVEQQQTWLQGERRRQRHALQLAARELTGRTLREVLRTDQRERLFHTRPDLSRIDADVLEPERGLVRDLAHHDLVLRILEDRGHRSRQLGRTRLARIDAADDDAALEATSVEMRDERRERAQ